MIQKGNFKAHLELHSVNPVGDEAITFTHTHERSATHAEFMTHRVSRNASSSRAIPFEKMIAWIDKDPAMPLHLGINKKGMQSGTAIDAIAEGLCRRALRANYFVQRKFAYFLHNRFGLHKEICNRYVEDYGWINVVSTWSRPAFMNYIALRCTKYAEPRIQRLAINMLREYDASTPQPLSPGEWHIPFIKDLHPYQGHPISREYMSQEMIDTFLVWSVARSAWVSYQTVEGKDATYKEAKRRHDDCVNLKHATPCEHQKRANANSRRNGGTTPGFDEYRHMIVGESVSEVDVKAILKQYEGVDYLVA